MIALRGCTKILDTGKQDTLVFDAVNTIIPSKGVTVILGAKGSGKTTLVRLLSGQVGPTEGAVERYCRVSFPFGSLGRLYKKQTGRQLADHFAFLYGQDRKSIVAFLSRIPDMSSILDEYVWDLPGPSRYKLAYALGFALFFDMYMIDTTPVVGDEAFQLFCSNALRERRVLSGIVLATSNVRHASNLADKVMVIHNKSILSFRNKEAGIEFFTSMAS